MSRQRGFYGNRPPKGNPNDTVFARNMSDLPAPVGGVITPATTLTFCEQIVDIGANLFTLPPGFTIQGYSALTCGLTSSNAICTLDIDFAASAGIASTVDVKFINTGAGDPICIDGGAIASIDNMAIAGGNMIVSAFTVLTMRNLLFNSSSQMIFDTNSPNARVDLARGAFIQSSAVNSIQVSTGVTLGIMLLENIAFTTFAGGVGINLIDDDTQVSRGSMNKLTFAGAGTNLNNFDETSDAWQITNSSPVPESSDQGVTDFKDSIGRAVTINTINVWEDIADAGVNIVYTSENTPQKFTLNDSNNGEQIYNGPRERTYKIEGRCNVQGAGGVDVVEFGISINGATPTADSIVNASISNTIRASVTIITTPLVLDTNDTVRLMVRNTTDASNIDFFQSKLSITF